MKKVSAKEIYYSNQSGVRRAVIFFAFMIGIVSVIYTNLLTKDLAEREHQQIRLYAKALETMANSSEAGDLTFLMEIVDADHSIPVILADEAGQPLFNRNIDIPENLAEQVFLEEQMVMMKTEHEPIKINVDENIHQYIYYSDSELIHRLKIFPYVQLSVILLFFGLVYLIYSSVRRAEQNSLWVGLAKETAHQLGTPLSSLMAWVEYFRADGFTDKEIVTEIEKDVFRLEMITSRFSNIGSVPTLKPENTFDVVNGIVNYLRKRLSSKIIFNVFVRNETQIIAPLNKALFEWVIENVCKNAADAMGGVGRIDIFVHPSKDLKRVQIDIRDTGKGMTPSMYKSVFRPGFTTKKRGWGLGLTLVKRIVENYHQGKIFVYKSEINKGTTFRVFLPKNN